MLRDEDLAGLTGSGAGHVVGKRERCRRSGAPQVGRTARLESLFLVETKLGDVGLAELNGFRLTVLQLYDTKVTDEGLQYLAAGSKELGELSLVGCRITDEGLKTLA